MMFTAEGYADAVAAFPRAEAVSTRDKPSASPAFAEALRSFCLGSVGPTGSGGRTVR
jgi:hypothetical protein